MKRIIFQFWTVDNKVNNHKYRKLIKYNKLNICNLLKKTILNYCGHNQWHKLAVASDEPELSPRIVEAVKKKTIFNYSC